MKRVFWGALLSIVFISESLGNFTKAEMKFYNIDNDQGLSNSSVNAIHKGPKGFMWFGTYSGLNRYDGYNIKVYKNSLDDSTSISSNWIVSIISDPDSNLWIGTNQGVNRYIPKYDRFKRYLKNYTINSLCILKDSLLTVCTEKGLGVYDPQKDSFRIYSSQYSPVNRNILDAFPHHNGELLVATDQQPLLSFDIMTGSFSVFLNDPKLPQDEYDKTLLKK